MKSKLFKIAHSIKGQFANWSDALKHAWKVVKLQMQLKKGEAKFKFRKVDGSIREAIGTLNFVVEKSADAKPKKENFGVIVYFDMAKGAYRSFKAENLIF